MSDIPQAIRRAVINRDQVCVRCGGMASDIHHRQRRGVSGHDDVRLLIFLCRRCHEWVHAHPKEARESGLIISSYETRPWSIPLTVWSSKYPILLAKGENEDE